MTYLPVLRYDSNHRKRRLKKTIHIDYRLRVHEIPVRWQSEITVWDPPFRFVDEQRHGPYRQWIHTHEFEERYGGTLCRDHVAYAVPGGALLNWLLVRRDVEQIFSYRKAALQRQIFGRRSHARTPEPGFARSVT